MYAFVLAIPHPRKTYSHSEFSWCFSSLVSPYLPAISLFFASSKRLHGVRTISWHQPQTSLGVNYVLCLCPCSLVALKDPQGLCISGSWPRFLHLLHFWLMVMRWRQWGESVTGVENGFQFFPESALNVCEWRLWESLVGESCHQVLTCPVNSDAMMTTGYFICNTLTIQRQF